MKPISLFLLTLFLISCKSNYTYIGDQNANYLPYYLKSYEADSLFLVNNYPRSYEILDSLSKSYEPIENESIQNFSNHLIIKAKLGKNISKKEARLLISKYGFSLERIRWSEDLQSVLKDINLVKEYPKLRKKYLKSIDLKLRETIKQMVIEDQKYRFDGRTHQEMLLQKQIDSVNAQKLITIFENVGFPNERIIGVYEMDDRVDGQILLLHTNDALRMNYFVPKLKAFVKNGMASPKIVGNLIDQYHLYKGNPQYYGTYENAVTHISKKELNRRRREIGLPNYGYEMWRLKKMLSPEALEEFEKIMKSNK